MLNKIRKCFDSSLFKNIFACSLALLVICFSVFTSAYFISQQTGFILRIILFCLILGFVVFLEIIYKIKPNQLLFFVSFLFILINAIVIFTNEMSPINEKFTGFANLICEFALLFLTVSLVPRLLDRRRFNFILYCFVCFMLFTCLFSAIKEYGNIAALITRESSDIVNPNYQIKSIFTSKNTFGFYLFTAIVSSVFLLKTDKNKVFPSVSLFVFGIFLLFSMAKTPIIFAFVISLYFFINFLLKKKDTRLIVCASSIFGFVILTFILCLTLEPIYTNITLFSYIRDAFFGNGFNSIVSRFNNFQNAMQLLLSPRAFIGYGTRTALFNYYALMGSGAAIDCSYLYGFLCGGVPYLVLASILYVNICINIAILKKHKKELGNIFLITFILVTLYGLFENVQIVSSSCDALLFGLLIVSQTKISLRSERIVEEKRVLHVVGSLAYGGTEMFVKSNLLELKKYGYEFDIYCFNNIDENVKVEFEKEGCHIFKGTSPSKKNILKAKREFRAFLCKNPYATIHLNANFDSFLYADIAYDLLTNNIICHAHDTLTNIHFNSVQKFVLWFKRMVLRLTGNNFLACSESAGEDIFGKNFFQKNGTVIFNGLDFDRFRKNNSKKIDKLRKEYQVPSNKIILGNITRFEPKKNQRFLIELMKNLSSDYFLILGGVDGGELETIKENAKDLNNVIFIGKRDDVDEWLQIFDYYLFPSLYEGLGIVAIESQLSGTKTIVSEFIPKEADLDCGLFVRCKLDIKDWMNAILEKPKKSNINFTLPSVKKYDIQNSALVLKEAYERGRL